MVDHKAGEAGEDLGETLDPESGLRNCDELVKDASAIEALGDPEGESEAVVACLALGIPHNKAAGGAGSEEGDGQVPQQVVL